MSKLKYYFAVDTSYVVKKLGLLVLPYTHKVWHVINNLIFIVLQLCLNRMQMKSLYLAI